MKNIKVFLVIFVLLFTLGGCVDQSQTKKDSSLNINPEDLRIIASSMATVEIMDKLAVDLVGIPDSNLSEPPVRYKNVEKIGMPMTPDIEKIRTLNPDYVFGPVSLISDLLPKYEAANIKYGFLNLNNIDGMYKSINDLGKILGKEKAAKSLIEDYNKFMTEYKKDIKNKEPKKVLILMGLPGSYIVATEHSYVGSLVELAGAENVYAGTKQQFLTINTEDMLSKNPDMILRTAHAMPDEVIKMFNDEFKTNDIWKHFECVNTGEVYDLDYNKFGMSAKFNYKEALEDLKEVLYE